MNPRYLGTTRGTCVCWSMASLTSTAQGSRVRRHGRSRPDTAAHTIRGSCMASKRGERNVAAMIELGLRNDVYRRPLMTALDRLGLREGWRCVDMGAGGGDVSVALAEVVGRDGRIYAVDSDPAARDAVAEAAAAAGNAQVIALTQAGEDLL